MFGFEASAAVVGATQLLQLMKEFCYSASMCAQWLHASVLLCHSNSKPIIVQDTCNIVPAQDYVLSCPQNPRLTNAYLPARIASQPNMNNTGWLPSVSMIHIRIIIPFTDTVEAPGAITDGMGGGIGIDPDSREPGAASEHTSSIKGVKILRIIPTVTIKLHNVPSEFLTPAPRALHAAAGARRDCKVRDFRAGCIAVERRGTDLPPQLYGISSRPKCRHIVHRMGPGTTDADDDQNHKHAPRITRRDD